MKPRMSKTASCVAKSTVTSAAMAALFLTAAPAAAQQKVCTVDVQAALASVQEGRDALQQLTGELERRQQEINQQQQELEAWMAELETQIAVLSPEQRQQRLAEYEQRVTALQQAFQAHQQELGQAEVQATRRIAERMMEIVDELAVSNACDLMLQSSAVLYAREEHDFTQQLIQVYDERH